MTENPPAGGNEQEKGEAELWTVSAGGFSATVDAFAVEPPAEPHGFHDIWLLSMVGPQASLKAIWASLLNMPPKPAHLTPGADGLLLNEQLVTCQVPMTSLGTWTVRMTRMANQMGWHAMTYTRMAEYSFERDDFLLVARPGEDEVERHHRFLDRRVSLPLHVSWAGWLWERGLDNGEIQPLDCLGVRAWKCVPVPRQLESDLSRDIATGILTLEEPGTDQTEVDPNG